MRDRFHRRFAKPSELRSCEIVYQEKEMWRYSTQKIVEWTLVLGTLGLWVPNSYLHNWCKCPPQSAALVFAHKLPARVLIPCQAEIWWFAEGWANLPLQGTITYPTEKGKETHRLKSVLGRDVFFPRRVCFLLFFNGASICLPLMSLLHS